MDNVFIERLWRSGVVQRGLATASIAQSPSTIFAVPVGCLLSPSRFVYNSETRSDSGRDSKSFMRIFEYQLTWPMKRGRYAEGIFYLHCEYLRNQLCECLH
jgi:hypothetical protein